MQASTAKVDPTKLVRIRSPEELERGDTVVEVVRFGASAVHCKYNQYEVLEVLRQAVRCRPIASSRKEPVSISFSRLHRHAKDQPMPRPSTPKNDPAPSVALVPPPPREAPAEPVSAPSGDALEAWLDMGRELVADIDRERAGALASVDQVQHQLEQIDSVHRRRIEQLERELLAAKQDHTRDRAVASGRLEQLRAKVLLLDKRRAGIEQIVSR